MPRLRTVSMLLIANLILAFSPPVLAKMGTRRVIRIAPRNTRAQQPASRTNTPPSTATTPVPNLPQTAPAPESAPVQAPIYPSFAPPTGDIGRSSEMTNQIPIIIPHTPSTKRVPVKVRQPLNPDQKPVVIAHYDNFDPLLEFQLRNARKGDPRSQYVLGVRYLEGIGVQRNEILAREYLEKSAAQGDRRASAKLKEIP